MAPTPRIGILGGSFDPVHNAHVALARLATDQLALDELRWIPTGHSWQKARGLAPAEDRCAMVRLAIAGEPRWKLDRREVERAGPSYTLDTVRELQAAEPGRDWVLVIGQDQYEGLPTWHGWRELLGLVTLAVANRPGSARRLPAELEACARRRVELPMMDVSSTDIRRRLAAGLPIADLVPAAVAGYIDRHRLYGATTGS
ncbi:MAG: nicotinate (nicotinamide) nucleotide adenylyltransferase [Proteobacteria bacterium]|nr:nicotinate (nicotinamide) nucleotide adenylyltransferase [Pseudomonadota bacterium]